MQSEIIFVLQSLYADNVESFKITQNILIINQRIRALQ